MTTKLTARLWTKFRLMFSRTRIVVDEGNGHDIGCRMYCKYLDGKVYVIKVEYE